MSEPLSILVAKLPQAEPDPARTERIRSRCRAQLTRRARSKSKPAASSIRIMTVWMPLIALLGAAYLTEVIVEAIDIYGLR